MKNNTYKCKMHVSCKKLFVGDICYTLNDEIYRNIWGKKGYLSGIIKDNIDTYAITSLTAYGDGRYEGDDFNDDSMYVFSVDAGNIGVTNMDYSESYYNEKELNRLGVLVNLPTEDVYIKIKYHNGNINIIISEYDDFKQPIFDTLICTN